MILAIKLTAGSTVFSRSYFGRGTGPIFYSNLACRGTESSILQCPRSLYYQNTYYCSHSRDAGIRCEGIVIVMVYTRMLILKAVDVTKVVNSVRLRVRPKAKVVFFIGSTMYALISLICLCH